MRILINTPDINKLGGVASHYRGLKDHWNEDVVYNFTGGRRGVPGPLILVFDYMFFFLRLLFFKYDVVLLNPSLTPTAMRRDALFLWISKLLQVKTIVFFHGWDSNVAADIDLNPSLFFEKYKSADSFIVLSSQFRIKLREWGIQNPIYLSTTKVEDDLVRGFNLVEKVYNKSILFLARIEKEKGVFIAIDAFSIVQKTFKDVTLSIVGGGSAFDEAVAYVKKHEISNVSFWGNVRGERLRSAFIESSIYILPTSHGEGMPTSILEAMAFGLPIVSRPVGGLVDFFEMGKMGYLVEGDSPLHFSNILMDLLSAPNQVKAIGDYNFRYAKDNFMGSIVCNKLEIILKS